MKIDVERGKYLSVRDIVKITSSVVESGVNNVGDKVYEKQRCRHLSPTGYEIAICRSEFRAPSKEIKHRYDSKMNEILMGQDHFHRLSRAGNSLVPPKIESWSWITIGLWFLFVSWFYKSRCNLLWYWSCNSSSRNRTMHVGRLHWRCFLN